MKKKLTILLAALFLITAFAGCSSKNGETQSTHNGNCGTSNTQGEEQTNDITGLGSSVADCFYAAVGVFGITLISNFLLKYQAIINIFGGGFILYMGIRLLIKKDEAAPKNGKTTGILKMFLSSFAVGITNPAAILTFLFAFSYFGISMGAGLIQGIMLVCGVFIGTYIWWRALTAVTNIIKKKTRKFSFCYMNRIFGTVLCLFGAVVLLRFIIG